MLGFRTRFWVNLFARVLPLAVTGYVTISAATDQVKLIAFAATGVLLTISEYVGVYRPLAKLEEIVEKQFDFYFGPFVDEARFGDGTKAHIRVNVMLVRWRLLCGGRLFQHYQRGMQGFADANLHFSVKRGLCGRAIRKSSNEVTYRDLRRDTEEKARRKYGWSKKQFEVVRHVKAVATAPLYRQRRTISGRLKSEYFGALNVDATNDAGAEFLADPQIQEQIKELANFVQISLG